jgi:hypothetical protein
MIHVLDLEPQRIVDSWVPMIPVSAPAVGGMDHFSYRTFQFGETLTALAKRAGLDLSDVKLIKD